MGVRDSAREPPFYHALATRFKASTSAQDHDEDVREFEHESASGADPDLEAWARDTLPTLRRHDHMAHRDHHTM